MQKTIFGVAFFLLLLGSSCNHTDEPETPGINLSAEDIGVTDALIRVRVPEGHPGSTITLERDGRTILSLDGGHVIDSIIVIDSLRPKHGYAVSAHRNPGTGANDKSNTLSFTTLDTTSHAVQWQTTTFGHGLSTMYDVAIINDSTAIAVGEIYLTGDSSAFPYAVAWWRNGVWSPQRVLIRDAGQSNYGYGRINSVQAFTEKDIWVVSDLELLHWDGRSWTEKAFLLDGSLFTGAPKKMWGTGGNNIYMAGRNGALYHYNGYSCSVIASHTTLDFTDIYGAINTANGDTEIYAVAANKARSIEKMIVRLRGETSQIIPTSSIAYDVVSIWFQPGRRYYAAGDGFFTTYTGSGWRWQGDAATISTAYFNRIRGAAANELMICGDFGEMLHFNGVSWHSYRGEITGSENGFMGMDYNGKTVIGVGFEGSAAKIVVGKR